MEESRNRSMMSSSVIVWAVILAMWTVFSFSPTALAADVWGAEGYGMTTCDSSTCDADVWALVLPARDVDDGDTVWIWYNFTWEDVRRSSSPQAQHQFMISATYPGRIPYAVTRLVGTYGDERGSDNLLITVPDVQEGKTINVGWYASIDIDATDCHDSDQVLYGIVLI